MTKSLEDKIRDRAYELWEQDGRVHGRSDEHWLKASLEVIGTMAEGELAHPAAAAPATAAQVHSETQTTVDAAGVVTPKRRPAAKKPAAAAPKKPETTPTPPASPPPPRRRAKPSV